MIQPERFTPPSPAELVSRVAVRCQVTRELVESALHEAGIALRSPLISDRRVQVLRVRLSGVKHTGEKIDFEQRLGPGLWAISHARNSAGKTSLLETIVWPLRGEPRDLPPDVRSWLRSVSVDAVVGGRCVRIFIEQEAPPGVADRLETTPSADDLIALSIASGAEAPRPNLRRKARILQALNPDALLASDDVELVEVLVAAHSDVEDAIGAFALDALGLEHTAVWNPSGGPDGAGAAQPHGWASYFGACYLNPGGDKLLFGDVAQSPSLSARLLELFIAVPYASTFTHLNAAAKRHSRDERQAQERASKDAAARFADREQWTRDLAATKAAIESVQRVARSAMGEHVAAADHALNALRAARQAAVLAEDGFQRANGERVAADQRALDAQETWEARRVLGLLNPVCCPRCEAPFDSSRVEEERLDASCAVCTRMMPAADAELAEGVIEGLRAVADELRRVEGLALADAQRRAAQAKAAAHDYEKVREKLDAISVSSGYQQLRELELQAARLEGQLAATGTPTPSTTSTKVMTEQIIKAMQDEVGKVVKQAADVAFPLLDQHIVDLARSFGVENLDSVRLQRNGQINAFKAGTRTPFGEFSRGDRLRMRIATVIAMLRAGAQLGTRPHPGLLLIDALGSEEVTTEPGRALVAELRKLAAEIPELQIVLTTATPELVVGVLEDDRIITGTHDHIF